MISVLLPYKNAATTLASAMESVLAERDVALELIAIDDGSTDDGPAIAARVAHADDRVRCIGASGVGIARALAEGVRVARGDRIGRMDGDDISLPTRFVKQTRLLDSDPSLGAVGVRVEAFPEVGPGMAAYLAWQNALVTKADHAAALFVESPLCHPSVLIRRDALEAVGGFRDGNFPEDYDLWLRLDAAGYGLAKVDEVLFRWRHRPDRATFTDPRCAVERFLEVKAPHLARRIDGRPFVIWGAGKTGRRLSRALEREGALAECFIDIDPEKIGRTARGRPIFDVSQISAHRDRLVIVGVGTRGARAIVSERLITLGLREGRDFLCAA